MHLKVTSFNQSPSLPVVPKTTSERQSCRTVVHCSLQTAALMQRLGHSVPANNKPNFYLREICVELGKSTFAVHSGPRQLLPHSTSVSTGTNSEFQLERKTLLETAVEKEHVRSRKTRKSRGGWGSSLATEAIHCCQKEIVPKFITHLAVWEEPLILWAKHNYYVKLEPKQKKTQLFTIFQCNYTYR